MYIKKLNVTNFRNYEEQKIVFSRETNIFYGDNAQGKTNLLEAVSLFSSGKSHRRAYERDLIKTGKDYAKVSILFNSSGVDRAAEIVLFKGKAKFIKVNGVSLRKTSELLGFFKCVVFSPEEMFLVSGSPEGRRNFLDLFLSSEKPVYYDLLKKYMRTLKQKNNLLKKEKNPDSLTVWNEALAAAGAKIMLYRKEMLSLIDKKAGEIYEKIADGKETFSVKYAPSVSFEENDDAKTLEARLFEAMERKKHSELLMGASVVGTHRDDLEFYISDKNAKSFSSQGQQRTAVIALKIAQSEIIKEHTNEYPVFLFDDVMSELDEGRRNFLSNEIKEKQVIITCTDRPQKTGGATLFYVENGRAREEG